MIRQGITTGNGCLMTAAGGSEGYFLSDDEWRDQVSLAASVADGRVPIIAGIFELSAREAVAKAEFAARAGCDFVQVAPPHYMVPTHREVIEHFRRINDAVDIGIFAYNTPWANPMPGYDFGEPVFEAFIEMENVVGVKWSANDQKFAPTARRAGCAVSRLAVASLGVSGPGPRYSLRRPAAGRTPSPACSR